MAKRRLQPQQLGVLFLIGAAFAALAVSAAYSPPARAQQFFDWFGTQRRAPEAARPQPPADFSRAPPPARRAADAPAPTSTVLVLGDSMADWLAYGLEEALAETPEYGVVRKHRTTSGLLRYDARNETQDWASVARELIATEKPNFIVMMVGLNDRQPIRERVAPPPARVARSGAPATVTPAATPTPTPGPTEPTVQTAEQDAEKPPQADTNEQPTVAAPEPAARQPQRIAGTHEFRSERWTELYNKRIDDTIAVLKGRGIPVYWVGLPSIRGPRSTGDMSYLNELFRARAEKAGIVFVDVWDGFVDEGGRFVMQGADFEGQIRRLRSGDGVYFTKSGARKLAHYVEREMQRFAARGPVAVALPATEPQPQSPAAKPGGPLTRPLAGPVMPLTAAANVAEDGLLGGANARPAADHVTVTRVLVNGDAVVPPAGRGDDFVWPRRGVAAFGTDPAVATTTLPLPVMQAAPAKTVLAPSADAPATVAAAPRRPAAPPPPRQQQPAPRPFFFPFFR